MELMRHTLPDQMSVQLTDLRLCEVELCMHVEAIETENAEYGFTRIEYWTLDQWPLGVITDDIQSMIQQCILHKAYRLSEPTGNRFR